MEGGTIVLLAILIPVIFLLIYEFFALLTGRPLVTTIIRGSVLAYPPLDFLIGLIVGLLLGHFFWL